MAFLYKVRSRGLFNPDDQAPFRLSRSKIDLFTKCPRCFYLDQRLGIGQPSSFPLTLNIAVDELLKKEFDTHRVAGTKHPYMETYGIDAVPFKHEKMELWRESLRGGIEYIDPETNLSVRGGVDDVWVNSKGELIIVDYKATAKREEITLDGDLGAQYKRQMEVYQWLFRKNGFKVSPIGYFVYVNGNKDAEAFDKKLEFEVKLLPCEGNTEWIDSILPKIKACLMSETLPGSHPDCDYCSYRQAAGAAIQRLTKKREHAELRS